MYLFKLAITSKHEGDVVLLSKRHIGSRYDGHPTLPEVGGSGSAAGVHLLN